MAGFYQPENPLMLLWILMNMPMSETENEYLALKNDYHLYPDWCAITMLKTVRRALSGDTELATALLYLSGYGDELNRLIAEDSVVNYMTLKMKTASEGENG